MIFRFEIIKLEGDCNSCRLVCQSMCRFATMRLRTAGFGHVHFFGARYELSKPLPTGMSTSRCGVRGMFKQLLGCPTAHTIDKLQVIFCR